MSNSNDLILALDIGTRTVIGIVGEYTEDDELIVKAHRKTEHRKRNMHDGQIHDIEGVVKTVREMVDELERELKVEFKFASIAAAGRALKTMRAATEINLYERMEFNRNQIDALELQAVQKAQEELNSEIPEDSKKYYNVGYTISKYFIDGEPIDSLEGHIGEKMGVEIIATFLPRGVVESLYTVIHRAGLEVGSMTLEPIAAINVAIKKDLRILNLALVDIGAGTSDIAITKEGEVVAYGMTQVAGDELTEELSRSYLLDFKDAEALKISLGTKDSYNFKNILGIEYNISMEEILEKLASVVEGICEDIAKKILEFNEKAPSAVFLVGGSSQFPKINEVLAEKLGLDKERVVIRDLSVIDFVKDLDETGPDYITPVGIAIEGAKEKYKSFIEVKFNGQDVRLFNTDRVSVADVMLLVGFDIKELLPKHSDEFVYYLNDRKRYLGLRKNDSKITVNNKEANIRTVLLTGDEIVINKEEDLPSLRLGDVVNFDKIIYYEGKEYPTVQSVSINDKDADASTIIKAGDRINVVEMITYGDFRGFIGLSDSFRVLSKGKKMEDNGLLKDKDVISFLEEERNEIKREPDNKANDIKVETVAKEEDTKTNSISLIVNGNQETYNYTKDKFIFVDIFDYIEFDLSRTKGNLVLKINDEAADYMMELKDGDRLEIRWE